jgi:hypothetical protein
MFTNEVAGAVFLQSVMSGFFPTKFHKLSGAFLDHTGRRIYKIGFSIRNRFVDNHRFCRQRPNEMQTGLQTEMV